MGTGSTSPEDHLLRTLAAVPVSSRVLDVGCRDGRRADRIDRLGFDLFGCDVDPERIERTRARLEDRWSEDALERRLVTANVTALGFPDAFFDWVVAHGVLHRAAGRENVLEMVRETGRVLRDGGWLHCAVPARPSGEDDAEEVPGDGLVERRNGRIAARFSPAQLTEIMREADLSVAEDPHVVEADDGPVLCAIYRKTEGDAIR